MTTQRIAAIATLAVGIAIGIALDRSGRRIVAPLVATETTPAVPIQKVSNGSIDPDDAKASRDGAGSDGDATAASTASAAACAGRGPRRGARLTQ